MIDSVCIQRQSEASMTARGFWLLLSLALVCAACGPASATGSPSAPAAPPSAPAAAPTARAVVQPLNPPVQVRYGSQEQVSGVGLYLAQEKGYFKEEGLEVEFIRVGGGPDSA